MSIKFFSKHNNPVPFSVYTDGVFKEERLTEYFGDSVVTPEELAKSIEAKGYKVINAFESIGGESFTVFAIEGYDIIVVISSKETDPHYVKVDGLLDWLHFRGNILFPTVQMSGGHWD
jgi:hypothetical protein